MDDAYAGARGPDQPGPARQVAAQTTGAAQQAAGEVAGTAKDQARQVAGEVRTQARGVAADVRDRVSEQARSQNDRLADGIRRVADELEQMVSDRDDSPARTMVSRVAGSSRQMADYLADRGPDGVLREVQDFARRRPGAFLAAALVGGFVLGRVGKSVLNASDSSGDAKPRSDAFVSDIPEPMPVATGAPGTTVTATTGPVATGTAPAYGADYVAPTGVVPAPLPTDPRFQGGP